MSQQLRESPGDSIQELVRRRLVPAFSEFLQCRSTAELHAHPLYRELESDIRLALDTPQSGDFRTGNASVRKSYRVVAWNIERGTQLDGQLQALTQDPYLREADVLLLTETDVGMARSGNIDIAREMAQQLGMCYAFVPCYLSLVKGSGVERNVSGENSVGLHGNAILSRYPIRNVRPIHLENGIDKVAASEKRLGQQTAIAAIIDLPQKSVAAASIHLCAQSTQRHRMLQMQTVLDEMPATGPAVIGGDWNTSTYDTSHAFYAIMGFWRRVFMGVGHVIRNHYRYPENYFERDLFQMLESRGFDYKNANVLGAHTVHYDIADARAEGSLREWVPEWCFAFIHWSLREHGGRCPFKLDWLAVRGLEPSQPHIVHEKRDRTHAPLSDHDAIGVDVRI